MGEFYSDEHRRWQDQFETRALADRVVSAVVHDFVREDEKAFIESRDMFFLSSVDERGMPSVSYKGGDPGFVRVVDANTLAFPSYDGNGMFFSMGNLSANGKVGLLFIDFERPHRMRVHGEARVSADDALLDEYSGAELVVRVTVHELFENCPRYVHRYEKREASPFVPRPSQKTPMPAWKRIDVMQDVLSDEERAAAAEAGLISIEEYAEYQKRGL